MFYTKSIKKFGRWAVAFLVLAVTGCFRQPLPNLSHLPDAPPGYPVAALRGAPPGLPIRALADSRLTARVGVAGSMARLGHHHVISGPIRGLFAINAAGVVADLYVPVAMLVVDDPDQRQALGGDFARTLSDSDRAGTRANMLSEQVLNASQFGFLRALINGPVDVQGRVLVELQMAGRTVEQSIQVRALAAQACFDHYQANLTLKHADFGLTPFAALGGALAVSDSIEVEIDLTGRHQGDNCET